MKPGLRVNISGCDSGFFNLSAGCYEGAHDPSKLHGCTDLGFRVEGFRATGLGFLEPSRQ